MSSQFRAGPAEQIQLEIARHGLEPNVLELETKGYTVIEPGRAASLEFVFALRKRLLEVIGSRLGKAVDLDQGEDFGDEVKITEKSFHYLLLEDSLFEEAVVNPVALALISYLLGRSCVLSGLVALVKGAGNDPLPLHTDNGPGMPDPFPAFSQVANVTWALTDYSLANGALCFVPGSHLRCRHPQGTEKWPGSEGNDSAVAVEAPAGSLIIWHGNLWHGAFPRSAPGIRLTLVAYFARMYLRPQEDYRGRVSTGVLEKHERLRTLLGIDHPFPVEVHGADYRKVAAAHRATVNRFG